MWPYVLVDHLSHGLHVLEAHPLSRFVSLEHWFGQEVSLCQHVSSFMCENVLCLISCENTHYYTPSGLA